MDFWTVILILVAMSGLMGWFIVPFTSAVTWYCEWRDGNDINWGMDTACNIAIPFAWLFSIFEIMLLYTP